MAREFVVNKDFTAIRPGAPVPRCGQCNIVPANNPYVVRTAAEFDMVYDHRDKELHATSVVQFCAACSEKLAAAIGWEAPETNAKLKGKLLSAEAARARAEKAQAKAEAALHAMQDWIADGEDK